MKNNYVPASVDVVSLLGERAVLIGSLTPKPIAIPKEKVSVEAFQEDQTFVEQGFGEISF